MNEEIEVQVPTLRLKPLDEIYNDHENIYETQINRSTITGTQTNPILIRDSQNHNEKNNESHTKKKQKQIMISKINTNLMI